MNKLSELFYNCAFDKVHWQEIGHGVNYAFVEEGDILYIYFQGSYQKIDWFRNFFFFPIVKKPYKDMDISYKVHRGFLEAWKEVEDIIIEKIKEKKNKKEYKFGHIIIVGYSHGGALAALCHECVWYWRPDLRDGNKFEGYGFEAPRVYAGWHVKKELKERWRNFLVIRTNNDLVTHCPPAIFRFCHVGSMLKVKGDVSLVKDKVPNCIKSHFPQVVYDALTKEEN